MGQMLSWTTLVPLGRLLLKLLLGQTLSWTTYKYEPLEIPDRHVRLLTLYPSENESTPIKCSTTPHSLNWNPSYEALSYTWGDPRDICPSPIDFNGYRTYISTNLEAALRALRYSEYPRVLWIDALYINQKDVLEKNRQIAMMGSIFETARNVVIWLGTKSEDSDLAMSAISTLDGTTDFRTISEESWKAFVESGDMMPEAYSLVLKHSAIVSWTQL